MAEKRLGVVLYPDPFLRRKADKISVKDGVVSEPIKVLAERMALTLMRMGGAGLAAPQAGYSVRMVIINLTGSPKDNVCLINPEILSSSEETIELPEKCLSIPGAKGRVKRPRDVEVKGTNLSGADFVMELTGWGARVLQHEVDHLNGILFIDHLTGTQKSLAQNKLKKLRRAAKKRERAQKV